MSFDLSHSDFFQNPYPYYDQIRRAGGPHWAPADADLSSKGTWLFWRYSDALEIFKKERGISKDILAIRDASRSSLFDVNMLNKDGEAHLRLRRLVHDYFSAGNVRRLEAVIGSAADSLIGELRKKGPRVDLVADFAEPLPLRVITRLIGIPADDSRKIRSWSLAASPAFDSMQSSDEELASIKQTCMREFLNYIEELIAVRSTAPDDSMLSNLIDACRAGKLSSNELSGMVAFLLFAGHETTISLISSGLWLLLRHREQWELLRQRPDLLPGAVEEVLRYESPAQRSTFRIATDPVVIGGFTVEPGQQLSVMIGAANRDETEFPNAAAFDIQRNPNRHLAFGLGLHNCLGKVLARTEARVAIGRIIEHFPSATLVDASPLWRKNSFFRGLATLPARLA